MTRKIDKNILSEKQSFDGDQKLKPKIINITKRVSAPNYPYVNYILPDNANSAEKAKYNICQNIARYKRENDLSEEKLAKKIGVNKEKLIDIICSKIYLFNLEELIIYTDNLHLPFEIKITNNRQQSDTIKRIKV